MSSLRHLVAATLFVLVIAGCGSDGGTESSQARSSYEQSSAEDEPTVTRDNFGYERTEVPVEYYNPNTGTRTYHNLEVEFDDGQVDTIHFPNGGWMDSDHIRDQIDNGDGTITVVNEHGYEYTVEKPYPEYGEP